MKGKRRVQIARRRAAKLEGYRKPKSKSNYARKRAWLKSHALFGFQVSDPKPWRRAV